MTTFEQTPVSEQNNDNASINWTVEAAQEAWPGTVLEKVGAQAPMELKQTLDDMKDLSAKSLTEIRDAEENGAFVQVMNNHVFVATPDSVRLYDRFGSHSFEATGLKPGDASACRVSPGPDQNTIVLHIPGEAPENRRNPSKPPERR